MTDNHSSPGPVEGFIDRCQLRIKVQLFSRESFLALVVCLLGVCSLLLLGTRYIPFLILPLIACLGIWLAFTRIRSGTTDPYTVACQIDQQQHLGDQLGTAFYFNSAQGNFSKEMASAQYKNAAMVADNLVPEHVIPFVLPQTLRSSLWLVAAAILLFSLRIAVHPAITFEPPLMTLLFEAMFGPAPTNDNDLATIPLIQDENKPQLVAGLEEENLLGESIDDPEINNLPLLDEEFETPPFDPNELPEVEGLLQIPFEEMETADSLKDLLAEKGLTAGEESVSDPNSDTAGDEPSDDDWDESGDSLLEKLKQAFANMLETLDMASVDSTDSKSGSEEGSGASEEAASSGEPSEGSELDDMEGSEMVDAEMEGGEAAEEAGEAPASGSGQDSSGEKGSGENASAAGSRDGSKEFLEAEQLEVFGALEELYMERSENMRGDVMIETRLAESTASVPYNQRSSTHSDRGGAVSRDEIPAVYRTYIQNYFENLRKNTE